MKYSLQKFIPALSARLKKKKKLKAIISQNDAELESPTVNI